MSVERRLQSVTDSPRRLQLMLPIAAVLAFVLGGPVARTLGGYRDGDGQLRQPYGIATDVTGNVYVADTGNHRIQKFTSNGTFITKWGSHGSADGQFATSGLIIGEPDVATDPAGNVYVTDPGNHRIQKFTSNGAFITKWKFGTKYSDFAYSTSGIGTAAGSVYVADYIQDQIQKFTPSGILIGEWSEWTEGDGYEAQFRFPNDVATDVGRNVYITDFDHIYKFTSDGTFITKWGSEGTGIGQFGVSGPDGIATDPAGNVYVADSSNGRIQKFTSSGAFITEWGGVGATGIATDAAGNVYVAEAGKDRIQKFTSDGAFITKWGDGLTSPARRKRKPLTIPTTRRKAFFRPSCGLAKRCSARVTIKGGGKVLARGGYSISAHSSRRVAIPLTAAGHAALAEESRIGATLTIVDTHTGKRESIPVVLRR